MGTMVRCGLLAICVWLVFLVSCAPALEEYSCDDISNKKEKSLCFKKEAIASENPEFCLQLTAVQDVQECFEALSAYVTLDMCEKVDNMDDCLINFGILHSSVTLCGEIQTTDARDFCYDGVARKVGNFTICDPISNANTKYYCYKGVNAYIKDVSLCEPIEDQFSRELCYKDLALDTNNKVFCDEVTIAAIKAMCS